MIQTLNSELVAGRNHFVPLRFGAQETKPAAGINAAEHKPAESKAVPTPLISEIKDAFQPAKTMLQLENSDVKVAFSDILSALQKDDTAFFQTLFKNQPGVKGKQNTLQLFDPANPDKYWVTLGQSPEGKYLCWLDCKENWNPMLANLAETFTFTTIKKQDQGNNKIFFEVPAIDHDNIQLTIYSAHLADNEPIHQVLSQKIRMFVGDRFLVTVHNGPHGNIDKIHRLFREAGKFKQPSDLVIAILNDSINRYGGLIDSLSKDLKICSAKISHANTDDSVQQDFLTIEDKMDNIFGTCIRQKQVLKELLGLNEFHNSKFVPTQAMEKLIKELEHFLDVLDHYQDRKNGMIDLYRAKLSNDMDDAMKRLTSISILFAPPTIVGAFMGMNVPIPGSGSPGMFWTLVGAATAVSATLFGVLKRRKWL